MADPIPAPHWAPGFQDLRDRRVLVTGASSGIGAAVATAFGACGAHVGVHWHRGQAGAGRVAAAVRAAGGTATLLRADLTDPGARDALAAQAVERLGGLDVLVNNAGDMVARRAFADTDDGLLAAIFDLNVRAVAGLIRALVPALQASGCGNVINTGSIAARSGGGPGSELYAAAKGAIATLSKGLARELGPLGIRVNVVAPGPILTPLQARTTTPAALERVRAQIPLGRLGEPDDCVGAFLFLASPRLAGYVSGAVIEIGGGR